MSITRLTRKVECGATPAAFLTLDFAARSKSRLRANLDDGTEVAVVLQRGGQLCEGDLLVSQDGLVVEVKAAAEKVSRVTAADELLLARACYHLGNRHVALQILPGELRYLHDHVLDDMVRNLGLEANVTESSFQPEPGAYGDHPHAHGHEHGIPHGNKD